MTLEELQKLPFLRASKFEKTSTTLLIRSKDRTLTQADVEKYLTKNTIKFTRLPKPTEILIPGGKKIIFKPLKALGAGGLKFEQQFTKDLNDWFSGHEVEQLTSGGTITALLKKLPLEQNSKTSKSAATSVGSRNTRRTPIFQNGKMTISNNSGPAVSDVDVATKSKTYYFSLKYSDSFYIFNGSVGAFFISESTKKGINDFFGFDGTKMGKAFGKQYSVTTKSPNYSVIAANLKQLIIEALGPNVVLVNKISETDNHISVVRGFSHKVAVTNLNKDSYVYAETGVRKYNAIKLRAAINGANYSVQFQFRGTTATDVGPKYLRILLHMI